jgi:hypothetical protein
MPAELLTPLTYKGDRDMPFDVPREAKECKRKCLRAGPAFPTPAPAFRLNTPADVLRLLEVQVHGGRAEPGAGALEKARAGAALAGVALKAIEAGNIEARVEAIEAVPKQRGGGGKR